MQLMMVKASEYKVDSRIIQKSAFVCFLIFLSLPLPFSFTLSLPLPPSILFLPPSYLFFDFCFPLNTIARVLRLIFFLYVGLTSTSFCFFIDILSGHL